MAEEPQENNDAPAAESQEPVSNASADNTENTGNAEKSVEEKMLPQKALPKETDHGKKYSPWGVLIVIFALAFLIWLFGGKKDLEGASKMVPAGVSSMLSINCSNELSARLGQLPIWKDGKTASQRVIENMATGFVSAEQSELWRKLLGFCRWVTIARTADDEQIYIFETGNLHAVEGLICKDIASGFVKDRDKKDMGKYGDAFKVNTPKGTFYFIKMGTNVVLASEQGLLSKIIACYEKKESSLASIGVGLDNDEMQQTAVLSYFVPVRSKRSYFLSAVSELGGEGSCRDDAGVATRIEIVPDGINMHSHIVLNDEIAKAGETHGFFYYVGVIVLVILAVLIGIPGIFLLIVMAMAAYFYLVARWKGEIVPVDPPELPEMSPQMKQDMGQKSADEQSEK